MFDTPIKFFLLVLVVGINAIIYRFIKQLETNSCECSVHWKRDFIKYYALITLVYAIVIIFTILIGILGKSQVHNLLKSILLSGFGTVFKDIYIIIGIINIYILYTFTQNLLDTKCNCTLPKYYKPIHYYSKIIFYIYMTIIVLGICVNVHFQSFDIDKKDLLRVFSKK